MTDYPILHIYGQGHQHDDAWIVGNSEGLIRLAWAIIEAQYIHPGTGEFTVYCNDGEGYEVKVLVTANQTIAYSLAVPYTDADCKAIDGIWPGDLDDEEKRREAQWLSDDDVRRLDEEAEHD